MKRRFLHHVVLFVLLGYITSGDWMFLAKAQPSDVNAGSDSGLHLIVAVQGDLRLKRQGWRQYAPATFGTSLRYGDLLLLGEASKARVVYADLTVHDVPSGVSGVPRPAAEPVLKYRGSLINPTRGHDSGEFPIVISPRKTKLLNSRPTIQWTAVEGVDTYEVIVRGRKMEWRREVHSQTAIVYPADAPALTHGNTYLVEVIADGSSSTKEGVPDLGFKLLPPDAVKAVQEAKEKIVNLGLADGPKRFLIANLYATWGLNADWGLNAEAIEQLEGLADTLKEPAVLRLLGDLYLRIGLNRLAEAQYLKALALSQEGSDVEGQALAQNALGWVYEGLGSKGEAVQRLQKAVELYQEKLGDSTMVNQIQQRLATLQKP